MSIFNWFASKQPAKIAFAHERSGVRHVDAALPLMQPGRLQVKLAPPPAAHVANGKSERLERRELLYSVVRDAMVRAGVLAASYKFKVLSLDARGREYIIMMDLSKLPVGDTVRMAEIEVIMVQAAKMRHDILVTAVYWRVTEHLATGLSRSQSVPASQLSRNAAEAKASRQPVAPLALVRQAAPFEPLQEDEVAAFKRALASATPAVQPSVAGKILTSGRRNPAPPVEFEDTQAVDPDTRISPLSGTQFGDLN